MTESSLLSGDEENDDDNNDDDTTLVLDTDDLLMELFSSEDEDYIWVGNSDQGGNDSNFERTSGDDEHSSNYDVYSCERDSPPPDDIIETPDSPPHDECNEHNSTSINNDDREAEDDITINNECEYREDNFLYIRYHITVRQSNISLRHIMKTLERQILGLCWVESGEYSVNVVLEMNNVGDNPISLHVPFHLLQQNTLCDYIVKRINTAFQSKKHIEIRNFFANVRIFRIPPGNAIIPSGIRFDRNKIYKAHAGEPGCAFTSSIIAFIMKTEKKDSRYINLNTVRTRAKELAKKCGLSYNDDIMVGDFYIIERELKSRILVFSAVGEDRKFHIIYLPTINDKKAPLLLIGFEGNTYYPIRHIHDTYLKAAQVPRAHGMCFSCYSFHDNLIRHMKECSGVCSQCFGHCDKRKEMKPPDEVTCINCNRYFYTQSCFDVHKENRTCLRIKKCKGCSAVIAQDVQGKRRHECNKVISAKCL